MKFGKPSTMRSRVTTSRYRFEAGNGESATAQSKAVVSGNPNIKLKF